MRKISSSALALLVFALLVGLYWLGTAPPTDAGDVKQLAAMTAIHDDEERDDEDEHWEDEEEWDEEDEDWDDEDEEDMDDEEWEEDDEEEYHDFEHEMEWALAEQSLHVDSIEFSAGVAKDEVKTAVVTATLLLDHAELPMAINALEKAIDKTSSPDVKRALRLKLAEAYLENDDRTAAIEVARTLLIGE